MGEFLNFFVFLFPCCVVNNSHAMEEENIKKTRVSLKRLCGFVVCYTWNIGIDGFF